MKYLTIQRVYLSDCTPGFMSFGAVRFPTLELPWNFNSQDISCIPEGQYKCRKIHSNKFGECVEIRDVIGRTDVRIHYGNFTRDIQGCVLVGDSIKDIDGDGIFDVTNSKRSLAKLMGILPDSFILIIK